ncbi:hypothetical protein VTH82DRAFT_6556 [Thermothelomyces myriococcoides]
MASTVNRTGNPWNQETKEKFEGAYRDCKKAWIEKRKMDKKKAGGFFS